MDKLSLFRIKDVVFMVVMMISSVREGKKWSSAAHVQSESGPNGAIFQCQRLQGRTITFGGKLHSRKCTFTSPKRLEDKFFIVIYKLYSSCVNETKVNSL